MTDQEHARSRSRGARRAAFALGGVLAATCAGVGTAGCGPKSAEPLSVLLITLDTTRRDALSCFGGRAGVTPELDRLAREGLCYDWARTVAPLTLPAHASMLTGLTPARHGLHVNSLAALPASAETLAESARAAGIETAAFTAAVVLDRAFGLDQGFDVYDQPRAPAVQQTLHYDSRGAPEVADAFLEWLGARDPDRRFLAWVHFFDPHMPYAPPPEFARQAGGDPYLGEVAAMDRAIGRILAALRERGALETTLVIAVADHGESRGEHGEDTHAALCYDATLRVPLIVRHPDGWRAGERSAEIASVADVHPTAMEAMDLPLAAAVDGQSLFRREVGARGMYFESHYGLASFGWSQILGWVDERGKYLHTSDPELYDPRADPGERADLADQRPAEVARCQAELRAALAASALPAGGANGGAAGADAAMQARLVSLGYAGAGALPELPADPLDARGKRSPRDAMESYGRFLLAQTLSTGNRHAEAAALLEKVLAEEPENPNALFQYGSVLISLRRPADAIAPLEAALELGRDWHGPHRNLGIAYAALGKREEAVRHLELALAFEPGLVELREPLLQLLDALGRTDEAERYRAEFAQAPAGAQAPADPHAGHGH